MHTMPMGGDSAHTWPGAAAAFIGMWVVTMAPMMLPAAFPALRRYHRAAATGGATSLAALGYFFIWTVFGAAAFPMSVALTRVPRAALGVIVVIAGAWQLTRWKARHLACCRHAATRCDAPHASAFTAWRHGTRLGLECARCCGNLMIIPLAIGMMDLRAMVIVALAITLERVAPAGERVARAAGIVAMAAGVILIARGTI
jgi:predicted metal-binding membrane protein